MSASGKAMFWITVRLCRANASLIPSAFSSQKATIRVSVPKVDYNDQCTFLLHTFRCFALFDQVVPHCNIFKLNGRLCLYHAPWLLWCFVLIIWSMSLLCLNVNNIGIFTHTIMVFYQHLGNEVTSKINVRSSKHTHYTHIMTWTIIHSKCMLVLDVNRTCKLACKMTKLHKSLV